jgi:hypothetical protein
MTQVGFADSSDVLLVISHDGAGLFDCKTGERLARDKEYAQTFEEQASLVAKGIGVIEDQSIHVAGLFGGRG